MHYCRFSVYTITGFAYALLRVSVHTITGFAYAFPAGFPFIATIGFADVSLTHSVHIFNPVFAAYKMKLAKAFTLPSSSRETIASRHNLRRAISSTVVRSSKLLLQAVHTAQFYITASSSNLLRTVLFIFSKLNSS